MPEGTTNNVNPNAPAHGTTVSPEQSLMDQISALAEQFPDIIPPQFQGDKTKFLDHYKSLTKFATEQSQQRADLAKQIETLTTPKPESEDTPNTPMERLEVKPKDTPEDSSDGVDWNAVITEFGENKGTITPETRQKILDAGIPEALLDATLAGQKALWQQQVRDAEEAVGGRENLQTILDHVRDNFTPEEITAFNEAMGNPSVYKRVLRGLLHELADSQQTTQSHSKEPKPTPQGSVPATATGVTPFRNLTEMTNAMNDPRYNNDPGYTQEVQLRIAKSVNS